MADECVTHIAVHKRKRSGYLGNDKEVIMNAKTLTTALLLFLTLGAYVQADLILTVGSPANPYAAGDTISIPVSARVTGLTPNPLTVYSLAIDFGSDGNGFPGSPDHFSSFVATSAIGGSLTQTPSPGATTPFDFIIGWNGSVTVSSTSKVSSTTGHGAR